MGPRRMSRNKDRDSDRPFRFHKYLARRIRVDQQGFLSRPDAKKKEAIHERPKTADRHFVNWVVLAPGCDGSWTLLHRNRQTPGAFLVKQTQVVSSRNFSLLICRLSRSANSSDTSSNPISTRKRRYTSSTGNCPPSRHNASSGPSRNVSSWSAYE
jgi:hypothetical protein